MSIGLAIFLSALIFAVIYLYAVTRDRWNWKRGGRRIAIALGSLVLIIGLLSLGVWGYQKYVNRPLRQTAYADLALGMTMGEVKYVKGNPTSVVDAKNVDQFGGRAVILTKDLKENDRAENYGEWWYWSGETNNDTQRIDVHFDSEKKQLDRIICYSRGFMDCPQLVGVYDGMTEENVTDTLGEPSSQKIDSGSGTKTMKYDKLGIELWLSKKQVYMFGVSSSP